MEGKTNIPKCYQLEDSVHISPTGDVYPCPALENISLGNIKQQKLSEILVSDNFLTMKGKIKNLQCPKCWNDCALLNNFNHIYYRRMLKYPFKISQTIIPPRILNNMVYHER